MLIDHWAHEHIKHPGLEPPLETDDFDEVLEEMERKWSDAAELAKALPEDDWVSVASDRFGDGNDG